MEGDTRPEAAESCTLASSAPASSGPLPVPHRWSPPFPLDDAEWHASLRRAPGTARERILRLGALALAWSECTAASSGRVAAASSDGDWAVRSGRDGAPAPRRHALPLFRRDASPLPNPDVFLRLRLPHDLACDLLSVIESTRRRLSSEVGRVPWDEPWPDPDPRPSVLAARTFSTRGRRVPAWVGLLAILEEFVFTWDGESLGAEPMRRGSKPPAAAPRRHGDAIYIRDWWRCSAPGCTSWRNLEDHHLVYRSRRGSDDLSNRLCLCRFHHGRGEHGGLAACRGAAPLRVLWRLGRREVGVWYRNERRLKAGAGSG